MKESFKNYYEVLRVRPNDPPDLIQAAFLVQIKEWHPDKFATADELTKAMAEERAKLIIEAKRTLLNASLKAEYDKEFEARFPRRWEKLSGRERPKQRRVTAEEMLNGGVPKNESTQQTRDPNIADFQWLNFSNRLNPLTKRVIFNVTHFLELNPQCEVRFRFNYNTDWTPFSSRKLYMVDYTGDVAFVEMQARHISKTGKKRYSKTIFRVIVLTSYKAAMQRKVEIERHLVRLRNRMGLKLIVALVGSALLTAESLNLIEKFSVIVS
jgi:curved DNA-binding protein CbpA